MTNAEKLNKRIKSTLEGFWVLIVSNNPDCITKKLEEDGIIEYNIFYSKKDTFYNVSWAFNQDRQIVYSGFSTLDEKTNHILTAELMDLSNIKVDEDIVTAIYKLLTQIWIYKETWQKKN